jgi:hypothetical protein
MVTDILGADDDYLSLPEVVSNAARRASDVQLAIYVLAGVAIVAAALVFRPGLWHMFAAFGAVAGSFGSFGIAARELSDTAARSPITTGAWKALRGGSVLLGGVSALFCLFAVLALLLGTWKS